MAKKVTSDFDYQLPSVGKHSCKVVDFAIISEEGRTPYCSIDMVDSDGAEIPSRLYSARVPYFMGTIARQYPDSVAGKKLSDVLKFLSKNAFDIWVSYDAQYGVQIQYSEPRS